MKCCPACGQTLPLPAPDGVRLTPLKSRLFEAVRRAGPNGIYSPDLFDVLYGNDINGGPDNTKALHVHICQVNKLLKDTNVRIKCGSGNGSRSGGGYYRLVQI